MKSAIFILLVLVCVTHEEAKWALATAVNYWGINDRSTVQTVYIPPESRLRMEADRIEQERKDIPKVRDILTRIQESGICKD